MPSAAASLVLQHLREARQAGAEAEAAIAEESRSMQTETKETQRDAELTATVEKVWDTKIHSAMEKWKAGVVDDLISHLGSLAETVGSQVKQHLNSLKITSLRTEPRINQEDTDASFPERAQSIVSSPSADVPRQGNRQEDVSQPSHKRSLSSPRVGRPKRPCKSHVAKDEEDHDDLYDASPIRSRVMTPVLPSEPSPSEGHRYPIESDEASPPRDQDEEKDVKVPHTIIDLTNSDWEMVDIGVRRKKLSESIPAELKNSGIPSVAIDLIKSTDCAKGRATHRDCSIKVNEGGPRVCWVAMFQYVTPFLCLPCPCQHMQVSIPHGLLPKFLLHHKPRYPIKFRRI